MTLAYISQTLTSCLVSIFMYCIRVKSQMYVPIALQWVFPELREEKHFKTRTRITTNTIIRFNLKMNLLSIFKKKNNKVCITEVSPTPILEQGTPVQNERIPVLDYAPVRYVGLQARHVGTKFINAVYGEDLYDYMREMIKLNNPKVNTRNINAMFNMQHIYFKEKLIRNNRTPLVMYNIKDCDILHIVAYRLAGGAKAHLMIPPYTHVKQCEREIINVLKSTGNQPKSKYQTQGVFFSGSDSATSGMDYNFLGQIASWLNSKGFEAEDFLKLIEDVQLFLVDLINARNLIEYWQAFVHFVKFRTGKRFYTDKTLNMFMTYFKSLFCEEDLENQSGESLFSTVKEYLNKYDEIKHMPIFKKLYKLAMYALTFSVFDCVGIDFSTFGYTSFEAAAMKRKFHMGPDFLHTMLTTLIYICEVGYQCAKTGSLDPLYHSGSSYEEWYKQATLLKSRQTLLAFPEAHGFTLYEYLADIREVIEKGDAIYRHAVRIGEFEKKIVGSLLNDLKMILAHQTTKREAQKERTAPFCVCLYGGSSIGKTTITDMLFLQYGKIFDLPLSSEFKYTHNPAAKYWDGFNSSQWFVIMDDIAFMHPNKASEGDPSVMETIQTNNRVAFVPDQAALEDKGRTPFRARCVVATTNCEDLNAIHYFQTPLAMQRRFPFTIDVSVKEEYVKDVCMLDSSKTKIVDGEWPNYWKFHVKRPVPASQERDRQRAKLETVQIFTEVDDFLVWFSQAAKEHERIQKLVDNSSKNMSDIKVCKTCFRTSTKCICLQSQSWFSTTPIKKAALRTSIELVQTTAFQTALRQVLKKPGVQQYLEDTLIEPKAEIKPITFQDIDLSPKDQYTHMCDYFKDLGEKVKNQIGNPKIIATLVGATTLIISSYVMYNKLRSMFTQGQVNSKDIGSKPVSTNDAEENVWFRDNYELSSFDVSSKATSWNSLTQDAIADKLVKNTIHIQTDRTDPQDGKIYTRRGRAVCIGGHIYITNNHNLSDKGRLTMSIINGPVSAGITSNISTYINQDEIHRFHKIDVCVFRLRCLPPKAIIKDLFIKSSVKFKGNGIIISRNEDGSVYKNEVRALSRTGAIQGPEFTLRDTWTCTPTSTTQVGDCGALYLGFSTMGPQLLGLHTLGNYTKAVCTTISQEFVEKAFRLFEEPVISSASPTLSAPSAPRVLQDLHPKSVFRYIDQGTANVYGSFGGFKPTPKSKVGPTFIQQAVIDEGYTLTNTRPQMSGWGPWRIAAMDMVNPVTKLDNTVLENCKNSFINDIFTALPDVAFEQLQVYDDITTLNGAPGVKFVDKMNRNTSMGNPWKKGKKHFFLPVTDVTDMPDAVEFTPEVKERINSIISGYIAGERFMPNFCGNLKDQAVSFAKAKAGKTRVFLSGPGDWSFVVRKYLLSVVRIIQNNKYVFETAVGTNACSSEWRDMHQYLTKFGKDRMIAGDYAAFDKTMPSAIILAAFDILRAMCERAGYSPDDLRVVQGIAEDTAFPLLDFNGDLIECYGSNPSGHPLTVIINSLANSLYMRYCYAQLSPDKSAVSFKKHVRLMTYGDDNVMGVSPSINFFTHTTIQQTLAEAGIKYTMADKETASIPFIHMNDVSFLKRAWVFDEDVGSYLAPLEENSISNSMLIAVASKTLSPEYHSIAILESAHAEYFFYGKETFIQKSKMIQRIIQKCDLQDYISDSSFPTWDDLYARFWKLKNN